MQSVSRVQYHLQQLLSLNHRGYPKLLPQRVQEIQIIKHRYNSPRPVAAEYGMKTVGSDDHVRAGGTQTNKDQPDLKPQRRDSVFAF